MEDYDKVDIYACISIMETVISNTQLVYNTKGLFTIKIRISEYKLINIKCK